MNMIQSQHEMSSRRYKPRLPATIHIQNLIIMLFIGIFTAVKKPMNQAFAVWFHAETFSKWKKNRSQSKPFDSIYTFNGDFSQDIRSEKISSNIYVVYLFRLC